MNSPETEDSKKLTNSQYIAIEALLSWNVDEMVRSWFILHINSCKEEGTGANLFMLYKENIKCRDF